MFLHPLLDILIDLLGLIGLLLANLRDVLLNLLSFADLVSQFGHFL
jgi:hypothetical protein